MFDFRATSTAPNMNSKSSRQYKFEYGQLFTALENMMTEYIAGVGPG